MFGSEYITNIKNHTLFTIVMNTQNFQSLNRELRVNDLFFCILFVEEIISPKA